MLYFTANARDGISGASGASCNTCCCQNIFMRPGETNLIQINYAPWSLPIGWVAPQMEYAIDHDTSTCPANLIEGLEPPSNTDYYITRDADVVGKTTINMAANELPQNPSTTQTYSLVPLTGPKHGRLTNFNANGTVEYEPFNGFCGADYFAYKVEDQYRRSIIRYVQVTTACITGLNAYADGQLGVQGPVQRQLLSRVPYIDTSKIKTDQNSQMVSFPIYMPLSCRPCDKFRLTIKQPATNCDRTLFEHFSCFDISCKDC